MKWLALILLFPGITIGEDRVFLRKISGGAGPDRYELLDHRPIVPSPEVIEIPRHQIEGLDSVDQLKASGRSVYVLKNTPWSHFEVRSLAPGVSYMQSIGAGGGPSPRISSGNRPAATFRSSGGGGTAVVGDLAIRRSAPVTDRPKKRPFGWPAYDNPLERPAYRR